MLGELIVSLKALPQSSAGQNSADKIATTK
jgi:hypothetical protein